jgi:hypothetical protein
VREEADLAVALLAVIAELRAVARGVEPVLKDVVRVGAGIAAQARLILRASERTSPQYKGQTDHC